MSEDTKLGVAMLHLKFFCYERRLRWRCTADEYENEYCCQIFIPAGEAENKVVGNYDSHYCLMEAVFGAIEAARANDEAPNPAMRCETASPSGAG